MTGAVSGNHHPQAIPDSAAATLWDMSVDMMATASLDGYLTRVNPAWEQTLGYTPDALMSRPYLDFVHPEDVARTLHEAAALVNPGHACVRFDNRYRHKDGTYRWLGWNARLAPDCAAIYCVVRDVTPFHDADAERDALHEHRAKALEDLRDAEERFRSAFQNAPIGMALTALDGRVLRANHALCEITGYSAAELLRISLHDITHPEDLDASRATVRALRAGEVSAHRGEIRLCNAGDHIVWVESSASLVRDSRGQPLHMIVQLQDISERKRLEERLRHLAEVDALTGIRNRRLFEEDLHTQVARCRRYGEEAAMLMFDLDDFKKINDTYGHKVGDDMLKAVAVALKRRLRTGDQAARLGGDEFGVLLSNVSRTQADRVAADMRRAVSEASVTVGDDVFSARISVGIAFIDEHAVDDETVIAEADRSMYTAKRAAKRLTTQTNAG